MKARRRRDPRPNPARPAPERRPRLSLWVGLGLLAFLLLQYGDALRMPFVNDDFLFLDRTRGADLGTLLAPNDVVSHYYRPWSRELHFWGLQSLFDANPTVFHALNMVLWLASMALFFLIAAEVAGPAAAVVATAGSALLAGWATPVLWASGSQDLWMISCGLGFLWCFLRRRRALAAALLAVSLLSKETALVFPAIATAHELIVARRSIRDTLRAVWLPWLLVAVWAAFHPMVGGALLSRGHAAPAPAAATQPWTIALLQCVLSLANLDLWPRPGEGFGRAIMIALPGVLVWCGLLAWALAGREGPAESRPATRPPAGRVALWCAIWWALGWAPTLLSGVGFHNYYGLLGQCGAWLGIGLWLSRRRATAIAAIVAVGLLRSANALTEQAVLGNEWNHRRLATLTGRMHDDLLALRPSLPLHARTWFGDVPWGLGLITSHADSPALRVWYSNSTLSGGFYSKYRPRATGEPAGADFFFLFDRGNGRLVEVTRGPEPLEAGRPRSGRWEADHMYLAQQLFNSGDPAASAEEWRKLVTVFPERPDYAHDLAVALNAAARADSATAGAEARPERP